MNFSTTEIEAQKCFAEKAHLLRIDPSLLFSEYEIDGVVYVFMGLGRRIRKHPIVLVSREKREIRRLSIEEFENLIQKSA